MENTKAEIDKVLEQFSQTYENYTPPLGYVLIVADPKSGLSGLIANVDRDVLIQLLVGALNKNMPPKSDQKES
jgi:hypothetical protein